VYKCTEAGINSHITVPSKVCASQLQKEVKFCSEQKIDREDRFFIFNFKNRDQGQTLIIQPVNPAESINKQVLYRYVTL
jgi:hypothetical protein